MTQTNSLFHCETVVDIQWDTHKYILAMVIYKYIYIKWEREREREKVREKQVTIIDSNYMMEIYQVYHLYIFIYQCVWCMCCGQ